MLSPNSKVSYKAASPNRLESYITIPIPPTVRKHTPNFSRKDSQKFQDKSPTLCRVQTLIDEEQICNISCMNCQELISIDDIETHSKICTTVSENVKKIEEESYLSQVVYKLKKLFVCLTELNQSPDLRPGDKNYISIFWRLCEKALEGESIEETDAVIKSLSSLLVTFKGTLSIRVYADRLQMLIKEQKIGYQEQEIELRKHELESLKEKTEVYKNRAQVLQSTLLKTTSKGQTIGLTRKLNEINSDLGTIMSGSSDATAMSALEEEKHEENFTMSAGVEDLKKHFYSLCLSIKLKNAGKNHLQNISVQKMYNDAVEKKVPADNWPEFIANQLKNPMRFSEDSRGRRRMQPKSSALKLQSFEAIVEEESSET